MRETIPLPLTIIQNALTKIEWLLFHLKALVTCNFLVRINSLKQWLLCLPSVFALNISEFYPQCVIMLVVHSHVVLLNSCHELIILCSGDFRKFSCKVESVDLEQFNFVGIHAIENLQMWRLVGFVRSSLVKVGWWQGKWGSEKAEGLIT